MATHNDLGQQAELLAAEWLKEKGYEILHTNWRFRHHEIDIIAKKGRKLHVVEVKSRYSSRYGPPESSVTRKKFNYLKRATHEFLRLYPEYKWLQYDIVAITLSNYREPEFFLLEDVFM